MSPIATKLRRLSRFRLRTALFAVTILCLVLGLYVKRAVDEQYAAAAVRAWGGTVILDYQTQSALNPFVGLENAAIGQTIRPVTPQPTRPPRFRFLREKLGNHYFSSVVSVSIPYHVTAEVDAATLCAFRKLRTLNLSGTHVKDQDLKLLAELDRLEVLQLADTDVTDAGIARLSQLPRLKNLSLRGTAVSDAALRKLSQHDQLQRLELGGTLVTEDGVRRLQQDRPNCTIDAGSYPARTSLRWPIP